MRAASSAPPCRLATPPRRPARSKPPWGACGRALVLVLAAAPLLWPLAFSAGAAWAQPPASSPSGPTTVAVFALTTATPGGETSLEIPDKVWRAALEKLPESEVGFAALFVIADSPAVRRAIQERRLTKDDLSAQMTGEQALRIARQLGAQVALLPAVTVESGRQWQVAVTLLNVSGVAQVEVPPFALAEVTDRLDQAWFDSRVDHLAGRLRERVCPVVRDLASQAADAEDAAFRDLYQQAQSAFEAGNLEQAASLVKEAMGGKRPRAEYHLLLAEIYYRQGKIEAAAGQFKAAAGLAPNPVQARRRYGECLAQLGQVREAIAEFAAVVNSAPEDREAVVALARLYLREERAAEAAVLLKKALDMDPGNTDLALQLAAAYARTNRGEDALRVYQQLAAQGTGGADLLEQMARLQAQRQEFSAAFECYAQAAEQWAVPRYVDADEAEQLSAVIDGVLLAALQDARDILIAFSRQEAMREEAFVVLASRRARVGKAVSLLGKVKVPPAYDELFGAWQQAASLGYQALTDQVLFVDLNQPRFSVTASTVFEQAGREIARARQLRDSLTRMAVTP